MREVPLQTSLEEDESVLRRSHMALECGLECCSAGRHAGRLFCGLRGTRSSFSAVMNESFGTVETLILSQTQREHCYAFRGRR